MFGGYVCDSRPVGVIQLRDEILELRFVKQSVHLGCGLFP